MPPEAARGSLPLLRRAQPRLHPTDGAPRALLTGMTPADARQRRAIRDRRILDALRLDGSAELTAAALGISSHLVRRVAHKAQKKDQPDAVPPRRPYRRTKQPPPEAEQG